MGSVLALTLDEAPVPTLFFGLGARGKRAEAVADEAVAQVLAYAAADAPVDEHSADQLILPLAFAEGPSESPKLGCSVNSLDGPVKCKVRTPLTGEAYRREGAAVDRSEGTLVELE